jgi:predicted ATP-grasp superfamily ATP-dependent carboligase
MQSVLVATTPGRAIDSATANATGPLNVLLVATLFKMPYRVLRCAQLAGASVFLLGTKGAKGLAYSRYCREFIHTDRPIDGGFDANLAEVINHHAERLKIDMVLAGDAPSTRALIAIRDLVRVPCFPMPQLSQFDLLNDKWQFHLLCRSLGINCPPSRLFSDAQELERAIKDDELDFPLIAKPLCMNGGIGCIVLQRQTARQQLTKIRYRPLIVQDFIDGEDIAASVYCERGEVRAFVAHGYRRATYSTFFDDAIYKGICKLTRHLKLNGVLNFDMRRTQDGRVFYLECNPRVFFNIAMSMLAGINFVSLGFSDGGNDMPPKFCPSVVVRLPKAMLVLLHKPWRLGKTDWTVLKFLLSDPIPYFREEMGMEEEYSPDYLT